MNSTSNVAEAELQRKNVEKMVLACVPQAGISEIHDILAWLDAYGMRLVKQSDGMAQGAAHTRNYSCDRPECIKAQRDELAAAAAQEAAGVDAYDDALDQLWKLAGGNDHPVYKRFLDFRDSFAAPVTAALVVEAVELTVCCGREECGGECGNEWSGTEWVRKAAGTPAAPVDDDFPAFLRDVATAAELVRTGGQSKQLAARLREGVSKRQQPARRKTASPPAAPGIDRADLIEIIEWWNAYTGPVSDAIGEIVRRIRALADASPKGALVSVSPNNCRNRLMAEGKPYPKSDGPFNQQANSHGAGVSE